MSNEFVFSWAENAQGRMVHVDDVSRGLACACACPHCHEQLLARHGEKNEHGFAHHSDNRGANLRICYMVVLYKLAEQILQTKKKVHAPSYYGIFPEKDIDFIEVKVDSRYEREDKQPDVIATTEDGKQYLIEFTFDYKVQHKQSIDYKNLNCLEIDLSKQNLETVEEFLLQENTDRKWLNNQDYFDRIESRYKEANKLIAIKEEKECRLCELRDSCVGAKDKLLHTLIIENSGKRYRICKEEQYNTEIDALHQRQKAEEERRKQAEARRIQYEFERDQERIRFEKEEAERLVKRKILFTQQQEAKQQAELNIPPIPQSERTCFMCLHNLDWRCRPGINMAYCGPYISMGVPKCTPPDTAKTCKGFKRKI